MPTFHTTIELPLEVTYAILPGSPGSHDRYGAPTEPESPDDLELLEVSSPALSLRKTDAHPLLNLRRLDPTERRRLIDEAWSHV